MDLRNYRSGNINLHTVESSDQMLSPIGDNVVVAVTVEIEGNYLGQEINGKFRYLRVCPLFENYTESDCRKRGRALADS